MNWQTTHVEAIVCQAGKPDKDGNIISAAELRKLANPDQRLYWDEDQQALIYRGPENEIAHMDDIESLCGYDDTEKGVL